RKTYEQLESLRQHDRVDHCGRRSALQDLVEPCSRCLDVCHTLVAIVLAQLRCLEALHRRAGLGEQRDLARVALQATCALDERIDEIEIDRRDELAEVQLARAALRQRLLATLLEHVYGAAIARDGIRSAALGPEQLRFLPVPAVQRLRRLRALGGPERAAR